MKFIILESILFLSWLHSAATSGTVRRTIIYLILLPVLCLSLLSCRAKTTEDEYKTIQNVIETKLSMWKYFSLKKDPGFDLRNFKLHWTKALDPRLEYPFTNYNQNRLYPVYYYCYSPDSTKYVDIYSSHAELDTINGSIKALFSPDSDAHLVDLIKRKKLIILSLGTVASLDDIAWVDNNSFVIVGYRYLEPVRRTAPLQCNACIYHINLEERTLKTYISTRSLNRLPGYYSYKFPEFVKERH